MSYAARRGNTIQEVKRQASRQATFWQTVPSVFLPTASCLLPSIFIGGGV
jgi:hypothetical protein